MREVILFSPRRGRGFSLVEVLVSLAVFSVLMVGLFELLGATQNTWVNARSQLGQFREARGAFSAMTRRISDATLNPYWDYKYPGDDRDKTPTEYVRTSELHFRSGETAPILGTPPTPNHAYLTQGIFFQAPFGFHDVVDADGDSVDDWIDYNLLLNTWGYFIEFGSDAANRPAHANAAAGVEERWRFRLMEMRVPAQEMDVYDTAAPIPWFRSGIAHARPIADNIVALIISPQEQEEAAQAQGRVPTGIAPAYNYDTRNAGLPVTHHNLPPLLRITMVAVDEGSAVRLQATLGGSTPSSLASLLPTGTLFGNAANLDADLATLEAALLAQGIRYRIFSSTVRLRNAKWSLPK